MTARQVESELRVQREILKVQQREVRRTVCAILRLARSLDDIRSRAGSDRAGHRPAC